MKLQRLIPRIRSANLNRTASPATDRIRGHRLYNIRKRILLRDEYTCQKCGRVTAHGEVDHKVPLYRGGTESDENRVYLCKDCHKAKSAEEEKGRA